MTAAAVTASELRAKLDAAPLSRTQMLAIGATALLSALDGYDVLAVTFAAPAITASWGIGKAALGAVLSAGLVGMAAGSLLLAPLADRVGRRVMVFVALALMAVGMLGSATAHSVAALSGWRALTGLGIGVLVAVITPLAAETSNARRRALAVSIMAAGYPAGGWLGGLGAAWLLKAHGWPAVFVAGGVAALVLAPVTALCLTESPAFLIGRRGSDRLPRLNRLLAQWGHEATPDLERPAVGRSGGYRLLFAPGQALRTIKVTAANLLYVLTVYYLLSWLPQLVADAGFAPATASLVSGAANAAGVLGGVALGALANRAPTSRLTIGAMVGLALSVAALGIAPPSLPLLLFAAVVCGFFLYAGIAGLYALLAQVFAPDVRASGSGFVIGMGRGSSAAAPYLAGVMFAAHLTRAEVSFVFAAFAAVAAASLATPRQAVRNL